MHSVTAKYNEFCAQRWRYDSMYSLLFKHSFLEIFSWYKLCVENMNCRNQSMKSTIYVQVFYHAWRVGTFMLGKQDFSLRVRRKNLLCECEVWRRRKARATTTRVKLMFFPGHTPFFILGGQKWIYLPRTGQIHLKSTLWPASGNKVLLLP